MIEAKAVIVGLPVDSLKPFEESAESLNNERAFHHTIRFQFNNTTQFLKTYLQTVAFMKHTMYTTPQFFKHV